MRPFAYLSISSSYCFRCCTIYNLFAFHLNFSIVQLLAKPWKAKVKNKNWSIGLAWHSSVPVFFYYKMLLFLEDSYARNAWKTGVLKSAKKISLDKIFIQHSKHASDVSTIKEWIATIQSICKDARCLIQGTRPGFFLSDKTKKGVCYKTTLWTTQWSVNMFVYIFIYSVMIH